MGRRAAPSATARNQACGSEILAEVQIPEWVLLGAPELSIRCCSPDKPWWPGHGWTIRE